MRHLVVLRPIVQSACSKLRVDCRLLFLSDCQAVGSIPIRSFTAAAIRNVDDSRGDRFDTESADGRERLPGHRLGGEMRRELREREGVNALPAS